MKKRFSFIFGFGFLLLLPGFVFSPHSQAGSAGLHQQMRKMAAEMLDLFPYLFSEREFNDPKNQKILEEKIKRVRDQFSKASGHFKELPLSRRVSYRIFQDHLNDTYDVYRGPNKIFSQTMLRGVSHMCMSCHSLDQKEKALFQEVPRSLFSSDFEFAEFHFMTRNYQKADRYYEQFLQGRWEAKDADMRETALARKLFILTEIAKDPESAQNFLKGFSGRKDIPEFIREKGKDWEQGFKEWNQLPQSFGKENVADLEKLVHKLLGDNLGSVIFTGKEVVHALRLRGFFNDYLNDHPNDPDTPKLLYWIALLERSFEDNIFYPFAEMSLKECIVNYPSHPVAPKCFNEYEKAITFAYSGSSGTHIPDDVRRELVELKKVIGKDGGKPESKNKK